MTHSFYIASVWLHILAATVWIGGMAAFVLVVLPTLRTPEIRPHAAALLHRTGMRLRTVGWSAFVVLIATGTYNLSYSAGLSRVVERAFWKSPYGEALAYKLILFGCVLALSAVHDFAIGPRATRAWHEGAPSAGRLRRGASWMGRINLLLGLAIVAMAVIVVRGWP